MRTILLCIGAVLLGGCSQRTPSPSGEEQKPPARNVVDTITQRNTLEAGRKAGQQIRAIRADQDQKLQEVESE